MKIRNPNIEIRNKSEGMARRQNRTLPREAIRFLTFKILFPFVSDFEFRISNFPPP